MNRLSETRSAVVHETPGVTRDRKELLCEWAGTEFRLIDTGGVDLADTGPFGPKVAAQAREAVDEADLVLLVVDVKAGVTTGDEELADRLHAGDLSRMTPLGETSAIVCRIEFEPMSIAEMRTSASFRSWGTPVLLRLRYELGDGLMTES